VLDSVIDSFWELPVWIESVWEKEGYWKKGIKSNEAKLILYLNKISIII